MIIIYVTHATKEAAQIVVQHLLDRKLIACANLMPIQSCYMWEGRREQSEEIVTLLKTTSELWDTVRQEIESIHPYETPCIIRMDVAANEAYEQWVQDQTQRTS